MKTPRTDAHFEGIEDRETPTVLFCRQLEQELRKAEHLIAIIQKEADLRFDGKYGAEAMEELRYEAQGQWSNVQAVATASKGDRKA